MGAAALATWRAAARAGKLIAVGLAVKPAVALVALETSRVDALWALDPWPAAIPCVLAALFLAAGLELVFLCRGPLAWLRGATCLLGSCFFADVPLKLAGISWPSLGLLFWPIVALDLVALAWVERRAGGGATAPILAGAVGLSFLELVTGPLPLPLFYAHGIAATALAVWAAVRSLSDFRPA